MSCEEEPGMVEVLTPGAKLANVHYLLVLLTRYLLELQVLARKLKAQVQSEQDSCKRFRQKQRFDYLAMKSVPFVVSQITNHYHRPIPPDVIAGFVEIGIEI